MFGPRGVRRIVGGLVAGALAIGVASMAHPSSAQAASATVPTVGFVTDLSWGISRANMDRTVTSLASSGAKAVRLNVSWSGVERDGKGIYNTSWLGELDYAVTKARGAGLEVLMPIADGVPYWASGDPNKANGSWNKMWKPARASDYGDFVGYAVRHFTPMGVTAYEIWNEPNLAYFWPSGVNAAAYTDLLRAGSAAVRAANPAATVVLGGLSKSDSTYMAALYAAGAGPLFDVAAIHPYVGAADPNKCWTDSTGRKAKDAFCGIEAVRDVMVANGDTAKALWLTEFGWSTTTAAYGVTESQQATYLNDAFTWLSSRTYVKKAFWYGFRNTYWLNDDPGQYEANTGVLRTDFSPKASYNALTAVAAKQGTTSTPTTSTPTTSTPTTTKPTTTSTTTKPTTTSTTTKPTTTSTTTKPTVPTVPGLGFHSLSPVRILDSRSSVGGYASPWGPGVSRDVTVAGVATVPADASAVVLNATVTNTSTGGYLTVSPAGTPRPLASNLNWEAGQTVPNAVTVKVGDLGKVSVFNAVGVADVIFDVVGYYGGTGDGFTSLTPARVLDSRSTDPAMPQLLPRWTAGGVQDVQITGLAGVPATATAVVVNATVTNGSAGGYLTVWPAGKARPVASSLNWAPRQSIANAVTVELGSLGRVSVFNAIGDVDVIFDVVGYFAKGSGALFHPISPTRILDSRSAAQIGSYGTPWGAGTRRDVAVAQQAGIPADAAATLLNVTVTSATAPSYLTVWPSGEAAPVASSVNVGAGQTVPNSVSAKIGSGGAVAVANAAGTADVIVDAAGWYS